MVFWDMTFLTFEPNSFCCTSIGVIFQFVKWLRAGSGFSFRQEHGLFISFIPVVRSTQSSVLFGTISRG
jgi:hypothetical protein